MKRNSYKIANGTISVLEDGDKRQPAVLLLHGIPASAVLWKRVIPVFKNAGFRVLAPDLPGYGKTKVSDKNRDLYSLVGISDLLAGWLEQENLSDVWLVGHDIGGGVAQILACDHPQYFSYLTLSNCIVEDRWPVLPIGMMMATARMGLFPIAAQLGLMRDPYTIRQIRKSVFDRSTLSKTVVEDVFLADKTSSSSGRRAFASHLKALSPKQLKPYGEKLRRLEMPTLLAWAMEDRNQSWAPIGRRLKELIPHAVVEQISDAGHFFQLEKPKTYANTLLKWHEGISTLTQSNRKGVPAC